MRTALIDGDVLVFQAAAANEYEAQWSDWLWTLHADFNAAMEHLDRQIERVMELLETENVILALTDPSNWRKQVMPSYKSHRLKTRKPVVYQPLREYVSEKYRTYMKPGLEGDDVLGILSTHPKLIPGEKVIVSIDKDMKTIPGQLLDLREENPTVRVVSREEADRFHMIQTLAGDATDGYPGCPGVGMTNAERLLDGGQALVPQEKVISRGPRKGETEIEWVPSGVPATMWEIVVSAYQRAGLGVEAALENARVARICRYTDYDFKKQEVKLWSPTKGK